MPTIPQTPNERLATFVRSNGVKVRTDGDWLTLPDYARRMRCVVTQQSPTATGVALQLTVEFEPWPGRVLRETFDGAGRGEIEAVGAALLAFTNSYLHVLLSAFAGLRDDDFVASENWIVDGVKRPVTLGREVRSGSRISGDPDWYRALVDDIRAHGIVDGTHGLRIVLTRPPGAPVQCDVRIDGVPWERAQTVLAGLPWSAVEVKATARRFAIVRGGLDVGEAISLLATKPQLDDEAMQSFLISRQFSPHNASRVIAFVPLAFGRVLLRSLGVTCVETARVETSGDVREITLAEEPVYAEAVRLAEQAFTTGTISRELFSTVAHRSAEIAAATHALNAGQPAEAIVTAPPLLHLSADPRVAGEAKPWWRFW